MGLDQDLLAAVHGLAGRNGFLDGSVGLFTNLGLVILAALFLALRRKRPLAAAALAFLSAEVAGEVLNLLTARPRPEPFSAELDSFPSGHTTVAFALASVLGWHNRTLGIIGYALAALVGISRLYLGVHYPSDVLAGAILGTAAGIGASLLIRRWWPRG
jgi:undecaprenyl-diphosphatase